ncbi:MAG: hypothetical protein EOO61_21170 [Hymenobacter sp.]|nr:MAG: hypothetical protein EOO61_21170 [Hymenobacter sp.]
MLNANFTVYSLALKPVDKSLSFYFELRGVRYNAGTLSYWLAYKPASLTDNTEGTSGYGLDQAKLHFKKWLDMVKEYGTVRLTKKERFAAESAKQFYADFELTDEDANTAPFDNDKQVLVYKLLDFIKESVEQVEDGDPEEAKNIIYQIERLQQIIPSVTKAAVIKELSKVYAKVKSYSMKAFIAVYDVAKKELIKNYLNKGMHEMNDFIQTLHLPHH